MIDIFDFRKCLRFYFKNFKAIGTLSLDEGVVTWYSKDEIFWEKSKLSILDKMQLGISKFRNKICERIFSNQNIASILILKFD